MIGVRLFGGAGAGAGAGLGTRAGGKGSGSRPNLSLNLDESCLGEAGLIGRIESVGRMSHPSERKTLLEFSREIRELPLGSADGRKWGFRLC
jgi:hypothetical protein